MSLVISRNIKQVKLNLLLTFFCTLSAPMVLAQGGNSPFSVLGVGEVINPGNIRNDGMGGMGISAPHPLYGNVINPANLAYNTYTYFDVGAISEYKTVNEGELQQKDFGGNLDYISFGFPLNRNWVTGAGLRPYSLVNFETNTTEKLPDAPTFVEYSYVYEGGINQVYWANAFRLFKGFTAGLEIIYNFGSLSTSSFSNLTGASSSSNIEFLKRTVVSDFSFKPGINYSGKISEKMILNFGATYAFGADYNVKQHEEIIRNYFTSQELKQRDTLLNNVDGSITMPAELGIGLSIENKYKYLIGIDFIRQSWSNYEDFNGTTGLSNTYTYRFGAEWVPDITSVSSYLKRVAYRGGLSYEQIPFTLDGQQIEKLSASIGFSFPVNRGFSNLNFAAIYGVTQAGDNTENISEEFVQFKLGLTVNDRWFVRRRIN